MYGELIERIFSGGPGIAVSVLEVVNPDAYHAFLGVPGLLDFVNHPLAFGGLFANKNDSARPADELLGNPFVDRLSAAFLNLFPIIVRTWRISIESSYVANLRCSPAIAFIVETEKTLLATVASGSTSKGYRLLF